jgi:hypothetical protein
VKSDVGSISMCEQREYAHILDGFRCLLSNDNVIRLAGHQRTGLLPRTCFYQGQASSIRPFGKFPVEEFLVIWDLEDSLPCAETLQFSLHHHHPAISQNYSSLRFLVTFFHTRKAGAQIMRLPIFQYEHAGRITIWSRSNGNNNLLFPLGTL